MNNKVLSLSSREIDVLEHLNKGCSSKLIAKKLEISPYTVNGHLKSIYFKLNVNSRGEAQNRFNEYNMTLTSNDLISNNRDKEARASDFAIANIELLFQTEEKSKRAGELVIANADKAARASELEIANIELLFQTEEKSKRADELVIANADKAARASELAIANIELLFQTEEKSKRADELVIANAYKPALRTALLLMLKRVLIQLRDRAQDDEKQGAKRVAFNQKKINYITTTDELEALFPDRPR